MARGTPLDRWVLMSGRDTRASTGGRQSAGGTLAPAGGKRASGERARGGISGVRGGRRRGQGQTEFNGLHPSAGGLFYAPPSRVERHSSRLRVRAHRRPQRSATATTGCAWDTSAGQRPSSTDGSRGGRKRGHLGTASVAVVWNNLRVSRRGGLRGARACHFLAGGRPTAHTRPRCAGGFPCLVPLSIAVAQGSDGGRDTCAWDGSRAPGRRGRYLRAARGQSNNPVARQHADLGPLGGHPLSLQALRCFSHPSVGRRHALWCCHQRRSTSTLRRWLPLFRNKVAVPRWARARGEPNALAPPTRTTCADRSTRPWSGRSESGRSGPRSCGPRIHPSSALHQGS